MAHQKRKLNKNGAIFLSLQERIESLLEIINSNDVAQKIHMWIF